MSGIEFEKTLAGRYKVYVDPAFANGEQVTVGYKGFVRNQESIDKMRAFLATLDRETLSDNPKDSYSKAGFDYWTEDIARWDAGDHGDGSVGFFYCPYIPDALKEGKPFKTRYKLPEGSK